MRKKLKAIIKQTMAMKQFFYFSKYHKLSIIYISEHLLAKFSTEISKSHDITMHKWKDRWVCPLDVIMLIISCLPFSALHSSWTSSTSSSPLSLPCFPLLVPINKAASFICAFGFQKFPYLFADRPLLNLLLYFWLCLEMHHQIVQLLLKRGDVLSPESFQLLLLLRQNCLVLSQQIAHLALLIQFPLHGLAFILAHLALLFQLLLGVCCGWKFLFERGAFLAQCPQFQIQRIYLKNRASNDLENCESQWFGLNKRKILFSNICMSYAQQWKGWKNVDFRNVSLCPWPVDENLIRYYLSVMSIKRNNRQVPRQVFNRQVVFKPLFGLTYLLLCSSSMLFEPFIRFSQLFLIEQPLIFELAGEQASVFQLDGADLFFLFL